MIHNKKLLASVVASACLLLSACNSANETNTATIPPTQQVSAAEQSQSPVVFSQAKECLQSSPLLDYGKGSQQPSVMQESELPSEDSSASAGTCTQNKAFRFGAGRADITGPSAGKILMGNENIDNYSTGIHMRLFARSFVIGSPCNQKRVLMVLTDTGMIFGSVREAVLDLIKADPTLAPHYGSENLMLSATHTHSGPGGYSHYEAYNFFRLGFDQQAFDVIVNGIVQSLRQAHNNYERNTLTGPIQSIRGELLGANASRAPEVYQANPSAERDKFRDAQGAEVNTNRWMTLLRLTRGDGKQVGSLNWFAVHPTSDNLLGQFGEPISGDNKGYAMFLWERLMGSSSIEPVDQTNKEAFVSAFIQADSGDVFSYLWHRNPQESDKRYAKLLADAHKDERHPLTIANGTAQLAKAMQLYDEAQQSLTGAVDYRFGYVKMDQATVTDPVILSSLNHPPALDAPRKQTCNPSLGYSFLAGGRGAAPGEIGKNARMGVTCNNSGDKINAMTRDLQVAIAGKVPTESLAYAVGCQAPQLEALNLQCQAEKPVFLLFGPPVNVSPTILPFQIVRIGNLAIVGIPWEITTMAGRRIRQTVLDVLRDDGVTQVEITGLSNDFVNYLTTREEYAVQGYEGASNQFGPWTLAVVQQELRRLALSMKSKTPVDAGPTPPRKLPTLRQAAPFNWVDFAMPGSGFGSLVQDVQSSYVLGDTATAVFRTADPNNDLMTGDSFLRVERLVGQDTWVVVATDRDPETTFLWRTPSPRPQFMPSPTSEAEIIWRIPRNALPGTYRLRHQGAQVATPGGMPARFEGLSGVFKVTGTPQSCP